MNLKLSLQLIIKNKNKKMKHNKKPKNKEDIYIPVIVWMLLDRLDIIFYYGFHKLKLPIFKKPTKKKS